jgi:hypothetical protein
VRPVRSFAAGAAFLLIRLTTASDLPNRRWTTFLAAYVGAAAIAAALTFLTSSPALRAYCAGLVTGTALIVGVLALPSIGWLILVAGAVQFTLLIRSTRGNLALRVGALVAGVAAFSLVAVIFGVTYH